jgi:hypothetical protein
MVCSPKREVYKVSLFAVDQTLFFSFLNRTHSLFEGMDQRPQQFTDHASVDLA